MSYKIRTQAKKGCYREVFTELMIDRVDHALIPVA